MGSQEASQGPATAAAHPTSRIRRDTSAVNDRFGLDSGFFVAYLLCAAIVLYLVSVALLRDGAGPTGGYGPLVLLPVVWAALQGRRLELVVAVFGVAVVSFLPTLLIGAPTYPAGGWRAGMLLAVLAGATGFAIMQLVERVGHLAGDRLLSEAARAWRAALRDTDVLARCGDDEFGLLLPRCDQSEAEVIVARMRESLPDARLSAGLVE
jgi:hypothetical protein